MDVSSIIFCFGFLVSFSSFAQSEDFCEAFVNHENRITMTYRQRLKHKINQNQVPFHIIIEGRYWNFEFDTRDHSFQFDHNKSLPAEHFNDKFFNAVCLWNSGGKDGNCTTFLFAKHTADRVFVTTMEDNWFDKFRNLSDYGEPKEVPVTGPMFDFDFAHDPISYGDYGNSYIDFEIRQSDKSFSPRRLEFKPEVSGFAAKNDDSLDPDIKPLNLSREIIGTEFQWSEKRFKPGLIIFTQEDLNFYWCWRGYNEEMCEEQLMVNCSATVLPDKSDGTITILVVVLILLIIFIIGLVVAIFVMTRKGSEERKDRPKTQLQTVRSGDVNHKTGEKMSPFGSKTLPAANS